MELALLETCESLHILPGNLNDGQALRFFEKFSLDFLFSVFAENSTFSEDKKQIIVTTLSALLRTPHGQSMLLASFPYLDSALQAPLKSLRRLAAEQFGRVLGECMATSSSTTQSDGRIHAALQLFQALQDMDTGVSQEAESWLAAWLSTCDTDTVKGILLPQADTAGRLRPLHKAVTHLMASEDSKQRVRLLSLLLSVLQRDSPQSSCVVRESGLIVQLLSSELSSAARDPLSALSALNMVSVGLSQQSVSAGLSSQLFSVLAASFPVLLEDSVLRPGALRAGALFLKGVLEEEWGVAPMCVDGSSDSSSSGLPLSASLPITFLADKQAFTHGLRHILDDTGSESVEDEVSALDAVCDLAETRSGSELLLGDLALLSAVIERALGRPKTSSQEVRVASLHALASLAGLPRAHQWQERSAAILSEGAESILRSEVYQAAAAGNSQRSPAEIIHTYLKQPFHDLKGATYHAASALAVRHWFAAELCRNAELMERLLSPCGSESGQLACSWRFSLLTSLWTTVQASFKLEASSPDSVHRPTLLNVYKELQFAVQGGPYGLQLDNRSSKEDPIPLVATQQS